MKSRVSQNWLNSDWLDLKQGVKQRGTISTFMYSLFIDELLQKLEEYSLEICIYSLKCGNIF